MALLVHVLVSWLFVYQLQLGAWLALKIGALKRHLEKQNELLTQSHNSMTHELHKLQGKKRKDTICIAMADDTCDEQKTDEV